MANGLPTTFEHPGSTTSNSFPMHSNSASMQTPYNAGSRFLHHQSPPSSSRSDQFGNAPNLHPEYMPNAGLHVPNRGNGTDAFLSEARGVADRFHRDMSALLVSHLRPHHDVFRTDRAKRCQARTPSSLLNQVVKVQDENSTPLEFARRVIDEVKRVSSVLVSHSALGSFFGICPCIHLRFISSGLTDFDQSRIDRQYHAQQISSGSGAVSHQSISSQLVCESFSEPIAYVVG